MVGGPASFDTPAPTQIYWDFISPSIPSPTPAMGAPALHVDPSTEMEYRIGLNGLPPGMPIIKLMELSVQIDAVQGGSTGQEFDTEVLALAGFWTIGTGPCIRESPTKPSIGHARVLPQQGGLYQIDSFFDVFFEISIDDGQTWLPATNGAVRYQLVPAPGAAGLLALGGLTLMRRKR